MSETLRTALLFLTTTLIDLYLFILIIRILLAKMGAYYYDPFTQFIVKMTDFIVKPLRRFLPNVKDIELASLVLILFLASSKFLIIALLGSYWPNLLGLPILACADALKLLIDTFFYAILLQAILSWVQPYSPINRLLSQMTAPIMRPLQRLIPPVSGFDITPIPALIGLKLLTIILISPLMALGRNIAFS